MSLRSAFQTARAPTLGFGLLGIVWGTFSVQIPALKAALEISDGVLGLLLLCSGIGLISAMWLAPMLERWKRTRALPLSYQALGLSLPLPALASLLGPDGVWLFALAIVTMGLASGLVDILMNAQASALEQRHGRPLMNAVHGMFSAVYAVAAITSGLTRAAGVPPVVVFACAGLCLVMLAYRGSDPRTVSIRRGQPAEKTPLLPQAAVAACGVLCLLAFMAESTVESWSALYLERSLGAGPAGGALGPALLGLTMAIGRFGGHVATERVGEARMLVAGAFMAILGALSVAAAPGVWAAYAGFAAMGLGFSVIGPVGIAMAGRTVPPAQRTVAVAQCTTMGFAGFFIAPLLVGGLSELFGLRMAFALIGLSLLLVPAMAALGRRTAPA